MHDLMQINLSDHVFRVTDPCKPGICLYFVPRLIHCAGKERVDGDRGGGSANASLEEDGGWVKRDKVDIWVVSDK